MSIRTNPNKAVPTLLKRLATVEKQAELEDLKSELMKIKEVFSIVKKHEDALLDTLTIVDMYLRSSNIEKLIKEKKNICNTIRKSALTSLLPPAASLGESPRKTFQPEQKEVPPVYQFQGWEDFMERYNKLSHPSKSCFSFRFLLPNKNIVIKKRRIAYWWSGFIQSYWRPADDVVDELLNLQLIVSYGNDVVNGNRYIINPCILNEWVRPTLEEGYERYSKTLLFSREPFLALDKKKVKLSDDHWISIFNVGASYLDFESKWMARMKKLQTLHLGRWEDSPSLHIEVESEDFLNELRDQKDLRYLSLRGISRISIIPSSIVELESLKVLDLKACHNLETLPNDISSLGGTLKYLNMSQCYLLEKMPKGIEKLTELQVLKGFLIGSSTETPGTISGLANLIHLRRLSIRIGSDATKQTMEFEYLEKFINLITLKISWGTSHIKHNKDVHIVLPDQLEKLTLEGFPEEKLLGWYFKIEGHVINELCIRGGKLKTLEHDPRFKAKIVQLKYLKHFEDDKEKIKKLFPDMEYVEIKEVKNYDDFIGPYKT
ncbi:hypothetical protein RJT34_00549 [Clitoria ternatea]|uniref:Disease resistance R13L4/SHOC-2-like LRR domain-containing protein n=1 Tax=Clitoria ternatea TaxID=43366 RepID=A0AAN9Q043_CLITE